MITLVLPAMVAGLLAGCGSSSLSSSDLARHAAAVCRVAESQTAQIPTPSTPEGSATFLKRGIAVLKPELAQLKQLRPPGDLTEVYNVSITSFAKKVSYMKDTVRDLAGGEDPVIAMRTLQQDLAPVEKQEDGAWQALQISDCLNH